MSNIPPEELEKAKQNILNDTSLTPEQKATLIKGLETTKKLNIKVETDSKALEMIEKLSQEKQELEAELEDYKSKLEIIAERELEKRMDALGIPEDQRNYFRDNPEHLRAYEMAKNRNNEPPRPNVPLDSQYTTKKGFSSYEEMIKALREAERQGDQQAKAILNQLMYKTMSGIKKNEKGLGVIEQEQPSLKELTRRKRRKRD